MTSIKRKDYTLLLGENACELFKYFNVKEIHGLNYVDCISYNNTPEDAYIAGLTNKSPIDGSDFCFINLQRCNNIVDTILLVNHEMMHLALELFNYNLHKEEEIITWAENETRYVIEHLKTKHGKQINCTLVQNSA